MSTPKIKLRVQSTASSTNSRQARSESNASIEEIKDDQSISTGLDPAQEEAQRLAQAKKRYQDDLKSHQIIDVKCAKPEDDWQVAYVWSFIIKFNLRGRIARLECIEDFERCLTEPVANRPDDVLENTLICFLGNLKPGARNITPENIQSQLSAFITDRLTNYTEWTVWDHGWPINEEDRGSCCTANPHRAELGRLRYPGEPLSERAEKNPIKQVEQQGGGLFELDWRERIKILRQLVDWQLTHSETIRNLIHREFPAKASDSKAKKVTPTATTISDKDSIVTKELGLTRDRARVWSLDDSWRLYKSGNPFKRPCPLAPISTSRESYHALLEDIEAFGSKSTKPAKGSKETAAHKKLVMTINNEKILGERLRERIEVIEKEDARIQRARKRIAQALEMQQRAELRSTRTRRQGRKVDYVYDDHSDFEDSDGPSKRSRPSRGGRGAEDHSNGDGLELDARGRPVIPGERRSARMSGRNGRDSQIVDHEDANAVENEAEDDGAGSVNGNGNGNGDQDGENGHEDPIVVLSVSPEPSPAGLRSSPDPKSNSAYDSEDGQQTMDLDTEDGV